MAQYLQGSNMDADRDFAKWKAEVNAAVEGEIGVGCDDLPDENYWDEWNEGLTPGEMAGIVLDNNGGLSW